MKTKTLSGWAAVACLLAACGGNGEGPPLGDFPPISKKEGDPAFTLTAPSSKSPAPFVFTSSNSAVATLDGAAVTIVGPGTSTITASQAVYKSFGPTQASTLLTVTAVACDAGSTRIKGVCVAIASCIAPATAVNNVCTAPASGASATTSPSGRIFARVLDVDTWAHARDFCNGTVIDSVANWRLPTNAELADLYASGAVAGHGWVLGSTWTSTLAGSLDANGHVTVNLATGLASDRLDAAGAYVSCVR